MKIVTADPEDKLDYEWDFTGDYPDADSISAQTVTADDPGVTVTGVAKDGARIVAWATGGTVNTTVQLKCKITTTQGRIFVRRTSLVIQYR